jgi:hypothetical protein
MYVFAFFVFFDIFSFKLINNQYSYMFIDEVKMTLKAGK